MAAARAWVAGQLDAAPSAQIEPEALADARLWGFDEAAIAGLRRQLGMPAGALAVWPANVAVVEAFIVSATQWRTGIDVVDGRLRRCWIGLDYAGVRVSIEASQIPLTPALWTGIRIMEQAARDALNGEAMS